ncbi:MazG family protein [Streptosporangiaceae bacterium NEAU-GS5]|nr:MazG family protein [Streptosporangiaceae bacterium NEAU-GS5]
MALIVVTSSPRVAPGLLSAQAWAALRDGPVFTGAADHPLLPYLDGPVTVKDDPVWIVGESRTGNVVWLAAQDGDAGFLRAAGHAALALDDPPEIEVIPGSYDLPGARLLDMVEVMDRLREECPWDGRQTHETLVPYLLEEAYEVVETIESGDYGALKEELGDLLFQVAFHSRIAEGFDVDDVAEGIVTKLIRRHPHVFAGVEVSGADEVNANWEAIKKAEKAGRSAVDVPMGQPALILAAQLLRKAARAGAPPELAEGLGDLFDLVRQAGDRDLEADLRAAARAYRRRVEAWESRQGR